MTLEINDKKISVKKDNNNASSSACNLGLFSGKIKTVNKDGILVLCKDDAFFAKPAFSCLVSPKVNDVVLCAECEKGSYLIISVIERDSTNDMQLFFPGDVDLYSVNGDISLLTDSSINLQSASTIKLNCAEISSSTIDFNVNAENMSVYGNKARVSFRKLKSLIELCESVGDKVIQRLKQYFRSCEDHDEVNAKSILRKADKSYVQNSNNVIMRAKKDIKLYGERIHLS